VEGGAESPTSRDGARCGGGGGGGGGKSPVRWAEGRRASGGSEEFLRVGSLGRHRMGSVFLGV
jgi:hypothetical protein